MPTLASSYHYDSTTKTNPMRIDLGIFAFGIHPSADWTIANIPSVKKTLDDLDGFGEFLRFFASVRRNAPRCSQGCFSILVAPSPSVLSEAKAQGGRWGGVCGVACKPPLTVALNSADPAALH